VSLTTALRASVVLAALATGSFGEPNPATPVLGIASAEAKEFYTRKRVRGRWVTGHFTRRHSVATRRDMGLEARPTADRSLQDDPAPTTPAPKPDSVAEQSNKTEPVLPVGTAQPGTSAALSEAAPGARDERLLKLQAALHAHARKLASDTQRASNVPLAPERLTSPRLLSGPPEPKAVSFDFQSGVKTTVFTDGTSVEERFDPASVKGLAGDHPRRALGGSRR
jgi:hypothetical protein